MSEELPTLFPGLGTTPFRVTSPADRGYNCIAWAANDTATISGPSGRGRDCTGGPEPKMFPCVPLLQDAFSKGGTTMTQDHENTEEQTTGELIETHGEDIDRCYHGLDASFKRAKRNPDGTIEAKYEYHARQLIRAIFAFIEAVTYSVKLHAADRSMENGTELTDAERLFLLEVEYALKDNGEIYERTAHIRLVDNIRFAFALQEKSLGIKDKFNANVEWWACIKSSIKVRDRLMHPKWPNDIDVSPDEVITALKAFNGFKEQVMRYSALRKRRRKKAGSPARKKKNKNRGAEG